jgi:HTH-type transcriptional regulator/antitoxin HigA
MTQSALFNAYLAFWDTAQPFVSIANDADYLQALNALEQALESADDTVDDPMNPLIDMLSHAIEKYESRDKERGKAMVSRVLNGERALSRSAIEQLAARFDLLPSMFVGEVR